MVQTSTYILIIIIFLLGIIGFNQYFAKHQPTYGYGKLILICIAVEFVMLTVAVLIPELFMGLIYSSVCMGTYVCVYYRYRKRIGGEW